MLTETEKTVIINCAKKYDVKTVYLFGSSLKEDTRARDIDLGVKGIEPALFFKFYGELITQLPKPVDVVDLSIKNRFNDLVEKRGTKIYG